MKRMAVIEYNNTFTSINKSLMFALLITVILSHHDKKTQLTFWQKVSYYLREVKSSNIFDMSVRIEHNFT